MNTIGQLKMPNGFVILVTTKGKNTPSCKEVSKDRRIFLTESLKMSLATHSTHKPRQEITLTVFLQVKYSVTLSLLRHDKIKQELSVCSVSIILNLYS